MEPQTTSRASSGRIVIGLAIVVFGVVALLDTLSVDVPWAIVLTAAIMFIGLVLLANPHSPASRGWITIGAILTVVLLVSTFVEGPFNVGGPPANVEQSDFVVDEPVRKIILTVHAGSVDVLVGTDGRVEVERQLNFDDERPEVDHSVEGGVLIVEALCPGGFFTFRSACSVDHLLRVPAAVDVEIDTGSGSVAVSGLTGSVQIDTGSGVIEVSNVSGRVLADSGSGGVVLNGVSGETDVHTGSGGIRGNGLTSRRLIGETGSGSIDVRFVAAPDDVELEAGSGSVTLTVPTGSYDLDMDTGSGSTDFSGLDDDSASSRHIQMRTGSGSIRVIGE